MSSLESAVAKVNQIVLGKSHQVKLAVACMLARGHLLIEDLPGMGKTTLSHALATQMGLSYKRIQFTSDMLPADIIGVSIFDQKAQKFVFHPGPIFSQVVLADEINRASPKTQSALLEAMEEHQVSVEGERWALPSPFFVIATQNPQHHSGTFALPESQLDRFLMRISLGYPAPAAELELLAQSGSQRDWEKGGAALSSEQLLTIQQAVVEVNASKAILHYVLRLLQVSRQANNDQHPLSPRCGQGLIMAAKAWAFLHGRDYVLPEDVQAVFVAVAQHRIQPQSVGQASEEASQILAAVDPITDVN